MGEKPLNYSIHNTRHVLESPFGGFRGPNFRHMKSRYSLTLGLLALTGSLVAQPTNDKNVFVINNPDFAVSPHTGITRQHWKDASLYLLEGAFSYIRTVNDPMMFPKQPGISYPRNAGQVPTEKLEGVCRTLFMAAPLLKENPELVVNGISVAEYYRHQIRLLIDTTSSNFIKPRSPKGGPHQNLVEFGALAMSFYAAPDVLWQPLTQNEKDRLAAVMLSYGDGPTVASNWKFFNIFVLSFFKQQGYAVNEKLLVEYLQKSLADYRGEGWYNDAPAYDYYSMWAFQMYGVYWSQVFGNEFYPTYAQQFTANFNDLKPNYPYMFSKDGQMIMWGRSITYRFASVAPFPLMGYDNDPNLNYGWMRRIASGVLLQFLQHPEFLKDNVPTLGFYGAFEPAVQMYSCRGSAFWMGKLFFGLMVPEDSPFWTATENNGAWESELAKGNVYNKYQPGSEILITDYPNIGAAEVRAWCHEKAAKDWQKFRSTENYNRLSYNSAFPWQADGANGEVAMNYVVMNHDGKWEPLRLFTFKNYSDGVYRREAVLESSANVKLTLNDIPLPNGILRVDANHSTDTTHFRLGHYALPQLNGAIKQWSKKVKGKQVAFIDNGQYQLAMVNYQGWNKVEVVASEGLHPQSKNSSVLNVAHSFSPNKSKPHVYITLMLWKQSGKKWTNDELSPIKSIVVSDDGNSATVHFSNGKSTEIVL